MRSAFRDYFAARGHQWRSSVPLVPQNDPSLLFVAAGMVPFKGRLGAETASAEPSSLGEANREPKTKPKKKTKKNRRFLSFFSS